MKKSTMIFASLFLFGWGFAQLSTPAAAMPAGSFETRLVEAAHQQAGIDVRNGADISGDFTDPVFNAVVRYLMGIPAGQPFTAEDAAGITNIHFSGIDNPRISSLNGIEHLVNLEVLHVPSHFIEEVDFSNNLKLRVIRMTRNRLAVGGGIDVSMLEYLEELDVSENRLLSEGVWSLINQLDVTNNPKLRILIVESNGIEALDLSNNPLLEELNISNNMFTELDLTHNPNLRILIAGSGWANPGAGVNMRIEVLDLAHLSRLAELNITESRFLHTLILPTDLAEFYAFTGNNVPSLTSINISNAPKFERFLSTGNNALASVTLVNNPALTTISVSGSAVSTFDITGSDNIEFLNVFNAALTAIDVSHLTYLELLNIGNSTAAVGNNRFTELDVTNNPNLEQLILSHNNVSVLDVTNNPKLFFLNVDGNALAELDLSQSTALHRLWALDNNLTHIDISNTLIGTVSGGFLAALQLNNNDFADVMDVYGWWYRPGLNPGEGVGMFATGRDFTFWPQQNLPAPTGPPVITTESIPVVTIGQPFDMLMRSTGQMHQIWEVEDWPAENPQDIGLVLEMNGRLHGTALPGTAGEWNFQIRTTAARGAGIYIKDFVLTIVDDLGVGIETINLADAVQIFPNPVRNELNIAADNNLTIIGASIFNVSGQMIQSAANPGHQIDVSSLPQGIYFIRIETDQGTVTKHFVKE